MINEYLFLSDEHRISAEAYKPVGVSVEITGIENTPLWIAAYSLANKNEESAKKLSDVHTAVMQYSPLVLSCESSEYYNRILFPLVNELERKLRKLLYLAASISDNGKAKESIKQLEEKDFGEIFDLLFIDQDFICDMRKRINADAKSEFNGRSKYSKEEIKTYLESLTEHILWDVILGDKDVPSLRSRFRDVQSYRNDVMHAHNIDKEIFGKARFLFNKINKEMDNAICKLIRNVEGSPVDRESKVNTAISDAIEAAKISDLTDIYENISTLSSYSEALEKVLKMKSEFQINNTFTFPTEIINKLQYPMWNYKMKLNKIINILKTTTQKTVQEPIKNFSSNLDKDDETEEIGGEKTKNDNNERKPDKDAYNK